MFYIILIFLYSLDLCNLYNFDFSKIRDLVGEIKIVTRNFEKESREKLENVDMIFLAVTTYHVKMSNGLYG